MTTATDTQSISPLEPDDLVALQTLHRGNEWLRAVLCTLARRGVAFRSAYPERTAKLLVLLAPYPYYKGGQFLFDLMEWEDFMLDGPSPPIIPTVLDERTDQQLGALLKAIQKLLDGNYADSAGIDWSFSQMLPLDENLPALEPGFYLYQDVILGVYISTVSRRQQS